MFNFKIKCFFFILQEISEQYSIFLCFYPTFIYLNNYIIIYEKRNYKYSKYNYDDESYKLKIMHSYFSSQLKT